MGFCELVVGFVDCGGDCRVRVTFGQEDFVKS